MKQDISPTILRLLDYARLAPSVHNTQPWHFEVRDSIITISIDTDRILQAGDPTQRELWISLGCCLETLIQTGQGMGLKTEIIAIQSESITRPIAQIQVTNQEKEQPQILQLIQTRHSYRGRMKYTSLPPSLLAQYEESIRNLPGISVALLEDRQEIAKIANFTYQGMRLALSSPEFRKELAKLVNFNWSSARVGMPGFVLNKGLIGSIWEKLSIQLGIGNAKKAKADQQKVLEASALLFITSIGDVPSFWLNAGRAYMRVALITVRSGLSHSTIAAPVEAASFHEDIEKMLNTPGRIQAMIRIGEAKRTINQATPRLRVDELLT